MRLDLFGHLHRTVLAGARRQLDISDGVALVFHRQERGGQAAEQQAHAHQ